MKRSSAISHRCCLISLYSPLLKISALHVGENTPTRRRSNRTAGRSLDQEDTTTKVGEAMIGEERNKKLLVHNCGLFLEARQSSDCGTRGRRHVSVILRGCGR